MSILVSASRAMFAKSKVAVVIAAGLILVWSGPAAHAITYSTTGAPEQSGLGDTLGSASIYDTLQIYSASGTIESNTTSIVLNELIFTAGPNAVVPADYVNQFSFTENVTVSDGTSSGTSALTVPFNLSINYSDTLTIVGGSKISIPVGPSIWNIVVSGLSFSPNSGGSEIGFLKAQVSDPLATPLPAALVLFGSGLAAIGMLGRRKRSRTSAGPATSAIT